jgi:hypothetical protein
MISLSIRALHNYVERYTLCATAKKKTSGLFSLGTSSLFVVLSEFVLCKHDKPIFVTLDNQLPCLSHTLGILQRTEGHTYFIPHDPERERENIQLVEATRNNDEGRRATPWKQLGTSFQGEILISRIQ